MLRSFLSLCVLSLGVLLAASCQDKAASPAGDALILSDVFTALSDRQKLVRDYRYAGEATSVAGGQKVTFTYKLKQPRMIRADVSGIDTSFIFDGKHLAIVDRGQKKVLRQDLSKTDEITVMSSLHQFFGDYVCEGWKPPVTRPVQEENVARLEKSPEGEPRWVLITKIDDAELKEVRYMLRAPTADFL